MRISGHIEAVRRLNRISRIALVTVAMFALVDGPGRTGEYHIAGQGTCSDCHSAHASVRGETWSPAPYLLKNPLGEVALCMSCHDGTDTQAPDIVASGSAGSPTSFVSTQYASKYGSSAGFFQGDFLLTANPCGHDVAQSAVAIPPLSNTYRKVGGLVCSDCHAPHGNDNYRNLLSDPNPLHPGSVNITLGVHVKETTPVNAVVPNAVTAYNTGNVSFSVQNNMGAWCADCHDQLTANSTGAAPAHFRSHPSDVAIGGIGAHTELPNWISPLAKATAGFGRDVGDAVPGIPRLRYGSPTLSNTNVSSGDTVMCLSCHKAHGSKYKYGLTWPLHQPEPDMLSGCQQCHLK